MKVAVVGAGIAGNVAARELHREHDVTVFEAGRHVGGHTHTHA
ncbi:MAG: FAD-dependent oxidoreductase, partial [Steroidobacteraceae bacterium]|nr:FAD-dependent oxidoreductase [Steroidobacteraceae bacterium]